jgi:nucleotide-binding universal stress UspA family protein
VQTNFPISLVGVGELIDPHAIDALVTAARDNAQRILGEAQAMAQAAGVPCDQDSVVHALPFAAIVEAADRHGVDLIVMASHGRRGLEGVLLGSETHRVLTHSPCPVLVVR